MEGSCLKKVVKMYYNLKYLAPRARKRSLFICYNRRKQYEKGMKDDSGHEQYKRHTHKQHTHTRAHTHCGRHLRRDIFFFHPDFRLSQCRAEF